MQPLRLACLPDLAGRLRNLVEVPSIVLEPDEHREHPATVLPGLTSQNVHRVRIQRYGKVLYGLRLVGTNPSRFRFEGQSTVTLMTNLDTLEPSNF